ncbi:hypothetical protein [Candidatus Reidiella endopervernicosa]|uniref:Uncharacterized protein n=1 Tax=Candidatus Reidiella endopervernicosa TaxID=2738883 RepID=A0A6N0HT48_9GAMM|nr:hypothetical protein [Candidatus Reidiella endopervernicosa]QKQ25532.1 hypothetical protein HUE57_03885 [Candidatus Reidiella endopervernicosa]
MHVAPSGLHLALLLNGYSRRLPTITGWGVAIFAEACFGHPSPSKRQILNATVYAYGARLSCVRCVITSSRLYTTPQ